MKVLLKQAKIIDSTSEFDNKKIDELYDRAKNYGALGGKLLGAGGGGFLLVYMKKKYRKNF